MKNKNVSETYMPPLVQNSKLLLICTRQGLQVWYRSSEGVKRYLADNTLGSKEWFDLDLWTCDLNTIGVIYLLRATPAPSLVLIKWRGQQILSGQHLVYSPTDRPTYQPTYRLTDRQLQNNIKIGSHLF